MSLSLSLSLGLLAADVVLVGVLIVAVVTDLKVGRIRNRLTYPAMVAGLVIWTAAGAFDSGWQGAAGWLWMSAAGLLIAFVPMLIAFSLGGIGGGDVKLAGAIGALVGCPMVIHAMLYGFIAAAVVGIGLIVVKRMTRQTAGRLVQFFWLLMTGVRPNDPTTARSPRLATALPWAIGAIAAVAQYQWIPWLTTGVVWVTGKPFGT